MDNRKALSGLQWLGSVSYPPLTQPSVMVGSCSLPGGGGGGGMVGNCCSLPGGMVGNWGVHSFTRVKICFLQ